MEDDLFAKKLEEYKELGREYRYRDQMMVQEFSLSMIAAGIAIRAIVPELGTVVGVVIQVFGLMFLALLGLHLYNTNQDRRAALKRREDLREGTEDLLEGLGFAKVHQNTAGTERRSAPRLMVWFAGLMAIAWATWTAATILGAAGWIFELRHYPV